MSRSSLLLTRLLLSSLLPSSFVLLPSLHAQSTQAASTWSSTATQAISASKLLAATDLGPLPASTPLTIRLGLAVQNKPALEGYVRQAADPASPLYQTSLTPEQVAQYFAPSTAQVQQVVSYLEAAGFTNITVEPNRLLVSAQGSAAAASKAFHTPLEQFSQFGSIVFANTSPAEVPSSLGGLVTAVLGLNSIGHMKPTIALPTSSLPQYLVSYTPSQFQTIYSGASSPTASKTSIAVMAEGNVSGVVSDLRIAEKAFKLPEVPVKIVQVGLASTDVSGADEWDLDTQYSTGLAGAVKQLYIYATTSLSDSDLALEFSRWQTDNLAKVGSASLGECEVFPYLDGSMLVDDNIFLSAAAQGQTFFASSGDTGSFCPAGAGENGVPAGAPFVNYPAASPYVIGVGGTTLLTNSNGTYDKETSWYSGGGGISQFEPSPFWQSAAVSLLAQDDTRGVPDVAFDADPESGALVYVNGTAEGVGGTSLSSPSWMGIWARVLTVNPKAGFAGPQLYSLYNGSGALGTYPKGGFNDITLGTNGLYPALPGYDLDTGLGTPIISQLLTDLKTK